MFVSLLNSRTRTGRFLRTLSSSYFLLLAATVYSLGVVPVILTYTGKTSLGLWALVSQFGTYLTLLDAGLSGACIRQFVGPIVRNDTGELVAKFQNAFFVSCLQGLLIAVAGLAGGILVPWLAIPGDQARVFTALFAAQCLLVAIEFPFRPFNSLLLAQQRFEFNYLATAAGMMISLGLVWFGMAHGWGLWSLIIAGAFQAGVKTVVSTLCVARLWGLRRFFTEVHVRIQTIQHLFLESGSFFSGTFFGTLSGMAQSTLLSRWFGLEGVASWNVGSKAANLLFQLLSKFFESSFAGLSELYEAGRADLLLRRLSQLFGWVLGISLFAAAGVCLLNQSFVQFWTRARVDWPLGGDGAMALWLVGLTLSRGLAEQTKILLVWRWIRLGPAVEFGIWICLGFFFSQAGHFPGYLVSVALAPMMAAGVVYSLGLRDQYAAMGLSLLPKESRLLIWTGGFFFLVSILLLLTNQSVGVHVVGAILAAVVFGCLAIPRLRRFLSSPPPAGGVA